MGKNARAASELIPFRFKPFVSLVRVEETARETSLGESIRHLSARRYITIQSEGLGANHEMAWDSLTRAQRLGGSGRGFSFRLARRSSKSTTGPAAAVSNADAHDLDAFFSLLPYLSGSGGESA
jgi:hypothetical protein